MLCRKAGPLPGDWPRAGNRCQVHEAGKGTCAWREEMGIAISNALALMCWLDFRFLRDFSNRDLEWLLIGALLAVAVMWIISRRRRRWF